MRLPALLLAAAASVALAACGSDDESTTAASTASSTASGAFPVTVTHAFGTATIPKAPQRVATVGFN